MTVVGVGVSHDELVKHTEASLSGVPEGMSSTDEQCEYVGGECIFPLCSSLKTSAVGIPRSDRASTLVDSVVKFCNIMVEHFAFEL